MFHQCAGACTFSHTHAHAIRTHTHAHAHAHACHRALHMHMHAPHAHAHTNERSHTHACARACARGLCGYLHWLLCTASGASVATYLRWKFTFASMNDRANAYARVHMHTHFACENQPLNWGQWFLARAHFNTSICTFSCVFACALVLSASIRTRPCYPWGNTSNIKNNDP